MQISNRIVHNYSALAKRSVIVATHTRPFSISACQYAEKKSNEEQPRSVTHNYFESLKDYDEENSESYSKDRVEGSFWGGDPGQTKQPGDENDVSTSFMHRQAIKAPRILITLFIHRLSMKKVQMFTKRTARIVRRKKIALVE